MIGLRLFVTLGLITLLSACVSQTITTTSVPRIDNASSEVAEGQLLDVGTPLGYLQAIDDEGKAMPRAWQTVALGS